MARLPGWKVILVSLGALIALSGAGVSVFVILRDEAQRSGSPPASAVEHPAMAGAVRAMPGLEALNPTAPATQGDPPPAVGDPSVGDPASGGPVPGNPVPANPKPGNPAPSGPASAAPPPGSPHGSPTAASAQTPAPERGGGPGVTSTPPKLMAIARQAVSRETVNRISDLKHVQKVAVADAGSVRVENRGISLLAVDPVEFRSWAPKAVADEPAVWSALAAGEMIAETSAAKRLGLRLGASYQLAAGEATRLAASATFGLPGVDGIVGVDLGRRVGLVPEIAILIHTADDPPGALRTGVGRLLGKGAQVITLGVKPTKPAKPAKPAASAPRAAAAPARNARAVNVGRPASYLDLYRASAAVCPGLSWTVLAAVGQVESSHGRNNGPSSAGALGPMQFMPATWKAYGIDGDGDGKADIWSPYDAVPSAANYLCANGAGRGGEKLRKALWFYNHSWSYVDKVLGVAKGYERMY
ncbi:lytic transglycosylase domain-containing protein [Sinosporangium album]|nr:lytic transglycosylase domain-containing protein [Sinosporangium album]